ncbi:amino acid transporter heavy chain SLC3A1 [Cylas formicarius]|uniref:amino acid transporter heavy chain SLC3A1 n=1 Tax=Cylas formicarius TaxID=197179 RepID=UPI002958674D|nr:amino acid transporter heavy chain SLC3A1 [Cylas formicarius]
MDNNVDGHKLEISGRTVNEDPKETYKLLADPDMEEEAISRPQSLVISADGADEKMLAKNDGISQYSSPTKNSISEKFNGDSKLDIGDIKNQFVGLGKEELMKYVNDPFWIRVRWICFIGFWLIWAAMLVSAILLIYWAPKCNPPPPKTWWEEGPLTEVDSSVKFQVDGNIKGVILTWPDDTYEPFDESHDIIKLVQSFKENNTKVIMDIEPIVSTKWFERSEENDPEFSDYYIWSAGKSTLTSNDPLPPNNWVNQNNTSSWRYSQKRKQFYYSPFDKPHLNFRNEEVVHKFNEVILSFLSANVSGIRLRNAAFLLIDPNLEDEPIRPGTRGLDHTQYGFYIHSKTENLLEIGELLKKFKRVLRNVTEQAPLMVASDLGNPEAFKVNDTLIVDLPLESHLFSKTSLLVNETANGLNYIFNIEKLSWPLWKATTKALPKDSLDMIIYLLPGTPLVDPSEVINKTLLKIRSGGSVMRGSCSIYTLQNDTVFAFTREYRGSPGILVATNPTDDAVTVDFKAAIPSFVDVEQVTIRTFSSSYNETSFMDINGKRPPTAVPVTAKSTIVLEYVPKVEDEE